MITPATKPCLPTMDDCPRHPCCGWAHAERPVLYPWLLDWPVGRSDEFLELAGCRPTRAAGPRRSLRVLDGLDAGAGDPSWRGLSALEIGRASCRERGWIWGGAGVVRIAREA